MGNDDIFDKLAERGRAELARKDAIRRLRQKHPYVLDLIEVLWPYPDGLARQMVLHKLEKQRQKDGLSIPPKFVEAVQSVYNRFSIDSSVFKKRRAPPEEGLYLSPEGKGSGRWAVNRDRATAWLEACLAEPHN